MFVDLPDETPCFFDRIFGLDDRSGNGDAFYSCFHQRVEPGEAFR